MQCSLRHLQGRQAGYTLLEALVSMALLLVVVVPLLQKLSTATHNANARNRLVAVCLCDQEVHRVQNDPDQVATVRKRRLNGQEWTVRVDAQGTALRRYTVSALQGQRRWCSVVIYVCQ